MGPGSQHVLPLVHQPPEGLFTRPSGTRRMLSGSDFPACDLFSPLGHLAYRRSLLVEIS